MSADFRYLLLIIAIFISAVIETDIYLPAFPDMMLYFAQSEGGIQKILSINFLGLCLAGPIYGPISDAYGRKRPLIAALGLFFLGSLLTLYADDFSTMLFGRFLQGLGSGGCFTLGTALIYDLFVQDKATEALNKINVIVPFVMASAPLLGGYLNDAFGFRANFLVIAISVAACLFCCQRFLPETLPISKRVRFSSNHVLSEFYMVLTSLDFLLLTMIISLLFAGFLLFLSTSSVLFVVSFGVEKSMFPLYQASLLLGYLVASFCSSFLTHRVGAKGLQTLGLGCLALASSALVICLYFFPKSPLLLTAAMLPYSFGFIWLQTPLVTELMSLFPNSKGTAASVLTSLRLLLTAGIVEVTATFYDGTIGPTVSAVGLIAAFVIAARYLRRQPSLGH